MAQTLRQGVEDLSLTMRLTLAVLALASGVYTYLGVRDLLDGQASVTFFGAIIYSAAVSVGIYTFWSFLIRFLPNCREARVRRALYGAMALGAVMIVAMSSWLNAAALAGSAALEQHLAEAAEDYARDLDAAHNTALAAQSLLPDIQLAADRFARLAEQERDTGALTGTSGSGTVVQLLSQMSTQLNALAAQVAGSRDEVASLYEQGGTHLSAMRRLVTASGPITPRGDAFAEQAVALTGVIASMQQTSIAPAVRRAADGLERSFIAPAADGSTEDLRARQSLIVGNVANAVAEEAAALARAADTILDRPEVVPQRFVPLSRPEAVLVYATDFLPSWAGAISIDLLPAVLVMILAIVQGAIREREDPDLEEHSVTASDMMRAMRLYERMRAEEIATARMVTMPADPPATAPAPEIPAAMQPTVPTTSAGDDFGTIPQQSASDAPASSDTDNVTPLAPKSERGLPGS
ncbi:MAG: hypothetical protein AAFX39_17135 [Pseudomonadota bacterium]